MTIKYSLMRLGQYGVHHAFVRHAKSRGLVVNIYLTASLTPTHQGLAMRDTQFGLLLGKVVFHQDALEKKSRSLRFQQVKIEFERMPES